MDEYQSPPNTKKKTSRRRGKRNKKKFNAKDDKFDATDEVRGSKAFKISH